MSPRPFMCRKISAQAKVSYFKPRGIPMCELEEVKLSPDEIEAIKLADFDELYQADAAEKMGISRQTFGNIIFSARKKIADAILNGKAICINNEREKQVIENYECSKCGQIWEEVKTNNSPVCPKCGNSAGINKLQIRNEITFKPGRCRRGRGR